ncbi:MAG: c-type cytochrome [Calditrichaeota bacterium]|nr:c-type cytochrome [Candidatus Cloacimonadota bacterium]MCB1045853.1 c-type cytochrome [Calditrichota bacterium]MCB9473721.1 c-type cytochrome [Candidatus Delongbacteria bacterium]
MKRFASDKGSVLSGLFWGVVFISICGAIFTFVVLPGVMSHKQGKTSEDFGLVVGPDHHAEKMGKYHKPDLAEIEPVQGVKKPGLDLAAAVAGSAEMLARGQEVFNAQCVACHGAEGKGDAPAGIALGARNFTHSDGWKNGNTLTDIVGTLSAGLPPKMPTFEHLPAADRFALAHWVIKLSGFTHARPTAAQISALDERFGFSKDQIEPNLVPVSVAMQQIDRDNRDLPPLATNRITSTDGMKLVARVVNSMDRAGETMRGFTGWQNDRKLLVQVLSAGVPGNGFNPTLLSLTGDEWAVLQKTLSETSR